MLGCTCLLESWFSWDIGPGVGMEDPRFNSLERFFFFLTFVGCPFSAVANVHPTDCGVAGLVTSLASPLLYLLLVDFFQ